MNCEYNSCLRLRIYYKAPLCHKDTVPPLGGFGFLQLCLYGIRELTQATPLNLGPRLDQSDIVKSRRVRSCL